MELTNQGLDLTIEVFEKVGRSKGGTFRDTYVNHYSIRKTTFIPDAPCFDSTTTDLLSVHSEDVTQLTKCLRKDQTDPG